MLLFLSFFIFEYVTVKIYGRKRIRQISDSSFEDFKLAVIRDDFVRNAVETFHSVVTWRNLVDELSRATSLSEFIAVSRKHRVPIQRLLYEWNYVPDQDSPNHISNALNDGCIQEILRKLTDPSDFLSAAETCRGFQANALECYPQNFKALSLSLEKKSIGRYTAFPLERASNFLKIFGHFILDLQLISNFENDTIDMIAENCGETLLGMYIECHENTKSNFNALSQFKTPILIHISFTSMNSIALPESLRWLLLIDVKGQQPDLQCITKKFPKLQNVFLERIDHLSDTAFTAFITLNPQIERLFIFGIPNVSFSAIQSIGDCLPNLVDLDIDCTALTAYEYNEFVMRFNQFQLLKRLTVIVDCGLLIPAAPSVDSLVTNIPTIETLHLLGFQNFDQTLPGLLQLNELKVLELSSDDDVSFNTIIELVKGSSTLNAIKFTCFTISVSEIMDILKCSKNLNKLEIQIDEMDIALTAYNSILAKMKGHLEIFFEIANGYIDENIFKENMQRFKIVKKR